MDSEIAALKERNARVEADKAWERSLTRRAVVAAVTYIVAGLVMSLTGAADPWFGALIPVCGYLLSTLSLPFVRRVWQARFYKA